jgi:hypothetical protein
MKERKMGRVKSAAAVRPLAEIMAEAEELDGFTIAIKVSGAACCGKTVTARTLKYFYEANGFEIVDWRSEAPFGELPIVRYPRIDVLLDAEARAREEAMGKEDTKHA